MQSLFILSFIAMVFQKRMNSVGSIHKHGRNLHQSQHFAPTSFLGDSIDQVSDVLNFPNSNNCGNLLSDVEHYELIVDTLSLLTPLNPNDINEAWVALINYISSTTEPLFIKIGAHGDNDVSLTQSNINDGTAQKYLTFQGPYNKFTDEGNGCKITTTDNSSTAILYDMSGYALDQNNKHYWFFCLMIKFELTIGESVLGQGNEPDYHMLTFSIHIHNLCVDPQTETHEKIFGEVTAHAKLVPAVLPTIV